MSGDGRRSESAPGDVCVPRPADVLGQIPTGASLRTELAAAARSRGRTPAVASELAELREALDEIAIEPVDVETARRRVAAATGEEARLKERIAALRGDVRARRAVDAATDETLGDLESTAAELSSAQTERIAAEQAFERARDRVARTRDERERRLRLRDRLRNRRRDARRELAREMYPAFRDALTEVPGGDETHANGTPSEYEGPAIAASLAAVAVADVDGPVTLGEAAASWIDDREGTVPVVVREVKADTEERGGDRSPAQPGQSDDRRPDV
ncbi:hypothetical protein C461_11844 [Halorubrum aidingense JCM 13560]|uniref:Uncharacterized protein n=1 Tax=Halorubrum aidingense JCM 13560 TaxID=1230454 RepID=M0PBV7_9EURY|nr:hypothetical protein [Halorubrum aidingense]EMA66325.1 hypothetical protein C461_11844 [Halorubrum aidingense JCM 13560]